MPVILVIFTISTLCPKAILYVHQCCGCVSRPPPPPPHPLLSPIVLSHSTPGYHNIDLEMQSPTELNYQPPTPLRHDDFFSLDPASLDHSEHSSPVRPSDLSLPGTPSLDLGPASRDGKPPTVLAEDTSLESHVVHGAEEVSTEEDGAAGHEAEEETAATQLTLRDDVAQGDPEGLRETERETETEAAAMASEANIRPQAPAGGGASSGGVSGRAEEEKKKREYDEEEEGEMTQEKLKSLLGDINLEEGLEDEEMTEEKVQQILSQVQQAEKDLSSLAGWPGEQSGAGETTAAAAAEAAAEVPKPQDNGEMTPEKQQKR